MGTSSDLLISGTFLSNSSAQGTWTKTSDSSCGYCGDSGTWTASFGSACPSETTDFSADRTTVGTGENPGFHNVSTGTLNDCYWTFTGGSPSYSFSCTPPAVTYAATGSKDVTLRVWRATLCRECATKPGFITVTVPPECTNDAGCGDANVCTDDVCSGGTCTHPSNTAACTDDGNVCTNDVCAGGACTHPSNTVACTDDGNVCTNDVCSGGTCTHPDNTAACDDGSACTTNDRCAAGACVGGAAPSCDDGNVCTTDSCDPPTGCVHPNNTAACTDDGNVCTNDVCSGGTCTHPNNAAACDDGSACTIGDVCSGGGCHGGAAPSCDDGNVCTTDALARQTPTATTRASAPARKSATWPRACA